MRRFTLHTERGLALTIAHTPTKTDETMEIYVAGVGRVTLRELEARFSAYMNAGAPEPLLEGPPEERRAILECIANRGDSQMRALISNYLKRLTPG